MCQITRWYYASVGSDLVTPPWSNAFARDHTLGGADSRCTDSYGTCSSTQHAMNSREIDLLPIAFRAKWTRLSGRTEVSLKHARTRSSTTALQWAQMLGTHNPRLQVPTDTEQQWKIHTHACIRLHSFKVCSGFSNRPASGWHPLYSSEVLDLQSPSTFQLALVGRAW